MIVKSDLCIVKSELCHIPSFKSQPCSLESNCVDNRVKETHKEFLRTAKESLNCNKNSKVDNGC